MSNGETMPVVNIDHGVAATAVAVTAGWVFTRRLPTSRTRACHTVWRKREFRPEGFSTGDTPTAYPAAVATWLTSQFAPDVLASFTGRAYECA